MKRRPQRRRNSRQEPLDPEPSGPRFFEDILFSQGILSIAGVDEAGRGCLAGPVVAAAVILPFGLDMPGLKDSKQLSAGQRDRFFDIIIEKAVAHSVGIVGPVEIDRINILEAALKAMRIAVDGLASEPDYLLIDGPYGIEHHIPQKPIKRGDAFSLSIAAASVIAKVTRDRMMCGLEREYPAFSFSIHKGYGTALHLEEIRCNGPTPIHRKTFTVQGRSLRDMMKGERKTWRS